MIRGRRVHLTGSASADCDSELLAVAHAFVRKAAQWAIAEGAGLVVGAGAEPRGDHGEPCIFDWTALDVVASAPDPAPEWPALQPDRFVVVASRRGTERVPNDRFETWSSCQRRSDFELVVTPHGWRMGGVIRERQVARGDVLLVLGGGAGAEHLADLYRREGKPVVPIHSELSAHHGNGGGGGRLLHERALGDPHDFFRLRAGSGDEAARLLGLRLTVETEPAELAKELVGLLADLRPPTAFYVRLLDTDDSNYRVVESFFRDVVDVVVSERGFTPREMGRDRPEEAFMNVEIFKGIHYAGLVVVDLTGVRPNCTMELGYALARRRRFVISARSGTNLPFDQDKLPTYFWDPSTGPEDQITAYREWLDRYGNLPPIVE